MLIGEFGSLPNLLTASPERLRRAGASDQTAAVLAATRDVVRRVTTARLESRPLLPGSNDLREYLKVHIAHERVETVRVLYLDAARRLLAEEEVGRGDPDQAPFYVRMILARGLELGATGIIVAHNHPSGVMRASNADRAITRHLARAAEIVGIILLDHLVVTRAGCVSILADSIDRPVADEIQPRPAAIVSSGAVSSGAVERCEIERSFVSAEPAWPTVRLKEDFEERRRLAAEIRAMIRERRGRDALFPPGIFFDPSWNILLDVFACELECVSVSVKSASLAADVPTSTASRWIDTLCEKGVLMRWKDPHDRRRWFLGLSVDGWNAMVAYALAAQL
uniref:JAB domain-containing protein n=1 Tax=uncultured Sphingomonas sp. TaxID=158754 RepID=UPI0035CAA05A